MKNQIIYSDDNVTIVDSHDYNLSIEKAAEAILNKKTIVCEEYPDYGSDDPVECYGAQPFTMKWYDYMDLTKEELIAHLKVYMSFCLEDPIEKPKQESEISEMMELINNNYKKNLEPFIMKITQLQKPIILSHTGITPIGLFIKQSKIFEGVKKEKINAQFLPQIFKKEGKHFINKLSFEDLAGFFLNLDSKNQVKFLHFLFSYELDLIFPNIPDWEKIGESYGMKDWDKYDQEDVRMCAIGFNDMTEWDLYPHPLVWIRKFLLYANNHEITDKNYKGKKFGNYPNWAKYYNQLEIIEQNDFLKTLINY